MRCLKTIRIRGGERASRRIGLQRRREAMKGNNTAHNERETVHFRIAICFRCVWISQTASLHVPTVRR